MVVITNLKSIAVVVTRGGGAVVVTRASTDCTLLETDINIILITCSIHIYECEFPTEQVDRLSLSWH